MGVFGRGIVRRAAKDRSGSTLVSFALTVPVLALVTAGGFDFAWAVMQKTALQEAADIGAIAGGKELSLSDSRRENVSAVVKLMVSRSIAENTKTIGKKTSIQPKVTAEITDDPLEVTVKIIQPVGAVVGGMFGIEFSPLEIVSKARVVGQPNICVLALEPSGNKAISLEHNARVTGRQCAVYSNSSHRLAIAAKNSASLTASFICSRGGKSGGPGNFEPTPMTDCPGFEDPLMSRPEPPVGGCLENNLVVSGGMRTLMPGTYCGGLTITGGADVELDPGIYVIKDGPFIVNGGGEVSGSGVGLYFSGKAAALDFDYASSVSLEAPTGGEMAGMLVFESRTQPSGATHRLFSNNAPLLVGTIYIPDGELQVAADAPVAQDSAYTAIVTRKMTLYGGPHLILNTDYDKTDVPVPKGIRGAGQPVALVQ